MRRRDDENGRVRIHIRVRVGAGRRWMRGWERKVEEEMIWRGGRSRIGLKQPGSSALAVSTVLCKQPRSSSVQRPGIRVRRRTRMPGASRPRPARAPRLSSCLQRWQAIPKGYAGEIPTVEAKLVKFADLASHLPDGVVGIDTAGRAKQLADRKAGFERRFVDR